MNRALLAIVVGLITVFCIVDTAVRYAVNGMAPNFGTLSIIDNHRSVFASVSDTGRAAGRSRASA